MRFLLTICTLVWGLLAHSLLAQPQPEDVWIARDSFGVPHIYAPTDAGAAYGLAWAHAEDDFTTIQDQLLIVRSRSAEVAGKDAAPADLVVKMLGLSELVTPEAYETELSPEFRAVLEGYTAGLNAYASSHEAEVKLKGLFPVEGRDIVVGYLLGLGLLTNTANVVGDLLDGDIVRERLPQSAGSNGFAVNASKTGGEGTFLAVNSHQPLEGLYSWYEAHLVSEEGTNVLGATFPGGMSIFLGTNEHLGWTHTVNHADFNDVYELVVNEDESAYRLDGEWKPLEERKARIKVKIGPIRIPVSRSYFPTVFGPAFQNDSGYFALSFAARNAIKAPEQWWRMNKARNLEEFRAALDMQGITGTNIIYADEKDNILYLGNASVPRREKDVAWEYILPGDDSELIWGEELVPVEEQALYLNPESGYLFNTNNTPFHATAPGYNLSLDDVAVGIGYLQEDNNRSIRAAELLSAEEVISWQDFLRIKYDRCYPEPLYALEIQNLEAMLNLEPMAYPELAQAIELLHRWDRCTQPQSGGAALFMLSLRRLYSQLRAEKRLPDRHRIVVTEGEMIDAISWAQAYLLDHFGQIDIPLGAIQRHRRGEVDLPLGGGPDILAAAYGSSEEDGRFRVTHGDTYIQLVRWSEEGRQFVYSISPYGASNRPDSPHHTDQMQRYVSQQTKEMSLDWEQVKSQALRLYHPVP